MTRFVLFLNIFFLFGHFLNAQSVGIGTTSPHASAALEVKSNNQGILPPRLSTTQRSNIASPAAGLLVFDTDFGSYWFYDGSQWLNLSHSSVFENNASTIRQVSDNYDENLIFGRATLPQNSSISDTLFLFDYSKGSFHGGIGANSSRWKPGNIGGGSFSYGYNTFSSGLFSTSFGSNISAPSGYEIVLGSYNELYTPATTTGWNFSDRLFSIGDGNSNANRNNALTIYKNGNLFVGRAETPENSVAITDNFLFYNKDKSTFRGGRLFNSTYWSPDSLADYSFAFGYNVNASGTSGSLAFGYNSNASGDNGSTAIGYNSIASGENGAIAIGFGCSATGNDGSVAIGRQAIASGVTGSSVAIGLGALASGSAGATSIGLNSNASGDLGATAIGLATLASGDYGATALGRSTSAYGDNGATALGIGTTANGNSCTAVGMYNDPIVSAGAAVTSTSPIFIIGNGDIGSGAWVESNALVVTKNGYLHVGDGMGSRVYIGNNFIQSGSNTISSDANVYPYTDDNYRLGSSGKRWTAVWAVDGTINTSDRRAKKDIHDLKYGLNDIMKLRAVDFHWNKEKFIDKKHIGLIAQELLEVIPEVVQEPEKDEDLYGVKYADLVPVLIKGMQELVAENEELKKRLVVIEKYMVSDSATAKNE